MSEDEAFLGAAEPAPAKPMGFFGRFFREFAREMGKELVDPKTPEAREPHGLGIYQAVFGENDAYIAQKGRWLERDR